MELSGIIQESGETGLDAAINRSMRISNWGLQPSRALYALCRLLRPRVVIETGVAAGVSSAYILQALSKNGEGELHSIDVGEFPRQTSKELGFVIPEDLKSRWHLHVGDSRHLLPELLRRLSPVDLFVHDSDHSYEVMNFELENAYHYLRRGGMLAADDVFLNTAFSDFCRKFGIKPVLLGWRIGVGRKT